MKSYELSLFIFITITSLACIIGWVSRIYLDEDNSVEQSMEQIIKKQTGVNIDLSP